MDGDGKEESGAKVGKWRRVSGKIAIGGGAGLEGLADVAIMRDGERGKGRIGEGMNVRDGHQNPSTINPTSIRDTSLVGVETTTKNQSGTQNPTIFPATKPRTTSVDPSFRGCGSPYSRREQDKTHTPQRTKFNILDFNGA